MSRFIDILIKLLLKTLNMLIIIHFKCIAVNNFSVDNIAWLKVLKYCINSNLHEFHAVRRVGKFPSLSSLSSNFPREWESVWAKENERKKDIARAKIFHFTLSFLSWLLESEKLFLFLSVNYCWYLKISEFVFVWRVD